MLFALGQIKSRGFAPRAQPYHLLWGLMFLKLYDPEVIISGFLGVDEQTYRTWSFEMVEVMQRLKPVYVSFGPLWSPSPSLLDFYSFVD